MNAIKHADKRTNIPTADAYEFVDPSIEEIRKVRYARNESLDPQLVWRGKYPSADEIAGYDSDLVTDAPPIYIQEKIDPRVLIENLRRTAAKPEDEPELMLFDTFDGLDEMESVDFYKHDANWSNRMILGDSLPVMASWPRGRSSAAKSRWSTSTRRMGSSSTRTGRCRPRVGMFQTGSWLTRHVKPSKSGPSATRGNWAFIPISPICVIASSSPVICCPTLGRVLFRSAMRTSTWYGAF